MKMSESVNNMVSNNNEIAMTGSTIVDELIPILDPGRLTYVDANKFVPDSELKGEKPQNWDLQKPLKFATTAAAISLNDVSCTGVMKDERFILNYLDRVSVIK